MDARPRYSLTTGIPAVRVGWLIGQARRAAALDERGLAKAVGVRRRIVKRWETARQVPCDSEIEAIAKATRRSLAALLPPRDVVEFDAAARYLRVGGQSVSVADVRNDAVLSTYVALVREQRQLGDDDRVTFRQPDLDVLSEALDLDDDSLESRLRRIAGLDENDAAEVRRRLMRRRLAMPAVGLLAGSWGLARMAATQVDEHPGEPVVAAAAATTVPTPPGGVTSLTVVDETSSTVASTGVATVVPSSTVAPAPAEPVAAGAVDTVVTTPAPRPPVVSTHPSTHVPRPTATIATIATAATTSATDAPVIADAVDVINLTRSTAPAPDPGPSAA